jgi:hypothetical protein
MYGEECTTMSMLVSSSHPAAAGLQVPLVELLLLIMTLICHRPRRPTAC